jgi:quinoprotein glucose dehydrogenase
MHRLRPALLLALGSVLAASAAAPAAHAFDWEFQQWRTGLSLPVSLRFAPDGRLFHIELWTGRIRVFADTAAATATTWATVPIATANHRGLMGLALHPAFPDSPYVYFYHTHPSPIVNRVARMTDQGGVGTDYAVIVDGIPAGNRNNGGRIAFGPDGMMYLTLGDNEVSSYAPDPGDIRGKVLRYTPMGVPAPGNPFGAGNPVFAKGVRNAYGLAFDPLTGEAFFTENGPECDDEVNHLIAGADYGWGPGDFCGGQPAGTVTPLESFTPPIAPTGCCVYRGSRHPELNGSILFGGYGDDTLRRVIPDPADPDLSLGTAAMATESFGGQIMDVIVGPGGEIWACGPASIMRLYRTGVAGVGDPPTPGRLAASPNPFTASLAMRPPDGRPLERLDIVDATGRRVRAWEGPLEGGLVWDGRDAAGRPAPAGVYLVRARVAGREHGLRAVKLAP